MTSILQVKTGNSFTEVPALVGPQGATGATGPQGPKGIQVILVMLKSMVPV